ncbi:MAG: hypothetical protein WCK49_11015, partial [Myxococcaceae bacterium]
GLDISFFVEKTLTQEPNTAEIKIYNLNDANRKTLQDQQHIPVLLKAGYENSVGLLFKGDLTEAFSQREGPDWVTTIRSGDGLVALRSAQIQQSFKAGTPMLDVLKSLAKTLGISTGDAVQKLERLLADRSFSVGGGLKNLDNSMAVSGNSMQQLHKALKPLGLEASIQDNALQILVSKQALEQTAVLLSADTGLLGSPQLSNQGVLRAQALLNHELFPGRKIKLETREIKEPHFVIQRVNFRGDTAGSDWTVDLSAVALAKA